MLVFIGAADSHIEELAVFRIARTFQTQDRSELRVLTDSMSLVNSTECRLKNPQESSHQDARIKIVPASDDRRCFKLEMSRWNSRDKVNLAIMGMFQQHRGEGRERLDVRHIELKGSDPTGV